MGPDAVEKSTWTFPSGHAVLMMKCDVSECGAEKKVQPESDDMKKQGARPKGYIQLNVPVWKGGEDKDKSTLRDSVATVLVEIASRGAALVGFPVQPVQKWPYRHYFKMILRAVQEYLTTGKDMIPTTIMLCTSDSQLYTDGCDMCVTGLQSVAERLDLPVTNSGSDNEQHISITVTRGSLAETKADVLVNTTDKSLQLDSGAVSKALLAKAGKKLQQECRTRYPSGIKIGDIAVTQGYGLKCNHVFHGALAAHQDTPKGGSSLESIQNILQFVATCLVEASVLKCRTIAFPALGTGNLGYPPLLVAGEMVNAVDKFSQKMPTSTVQDIQFVIYPTDTKCISEFEKKIKERDKFLKEKVKTRSSSTTPSVDVPQGPEGIGKLRFGQVSVSCVQGAIKDAARRCQCMLYLWEKTHINAVFVKGNHLLKYVGVRVQQDWIDHYKKSQTNTKPLCTEGGDLANSLIIHMPCDENKSEYLRAVKEGLRLADRNEKTSVIIPLHCGHSFMKKVKDVATAVINGVSEMSARLQHVTCVELSIEDQSHYLSSQKIFKKHLEMQARNKSKEEWTRETWLESTTLVQLYLILSNPEGIKDVKDLKVMLFDAIMTVPISVIYPYKTKKDALLLFKTSEDANQAFEKALPEPWKFKRMEAQVLSFEARIEDQIYSAAREKGMLMELEKKLTSEVAIVLEKQSEGIVIRAANSSLLKRAQDWLSSFAREMLQLKVDHQSGTEIDSDLVNYSLVKVDGVSDLVYDVFQILKGKEMEQNRSQLEPGINRDKSGCVTIPYDEDTKVAAEEIGKYLENLKTLTIEEVPISQTANQDSRMVAKDMEWKGDESAGCIFLPSKDAVFAIGKTYEDMKAISHQFLVKIGVKKVTGRHRRGNRQLEPSPEADQAQGTPGTTFNQALTSPSTRTSRFSWSTDAKCEEKYETAEGITVYVYEANILKLPVDCIVNAANDSLQHGGGIARVIERAAGYDLTREGNDFLRKNGRIPVGQVCVTTAGHLPYDCVIHTVGPCWSDYRPHTQDKVDACETDLFHAIINSLFMAEARHLKSIAVPAISSAIFAVPEEICVMQYARATLDYSRRSANTPTALREIHFIDKNRHIVQQIQAVFTSILRPGREPTYNKQKYVKPPRLPPPRPPYTPPVGNSQFYDMEESQNGKGSESWQLVDKKARNQTSTDPSCSIVCYDQNVSSEHKRLICRVGTHCVVNVYRADIVTLKDVHICMCSDDSHGNGKGVVARKLGKAAGKAHTDDKQKNFNKWRKEGSVVTTNGGNLDFKRIFYAILPHNTGIKERKQLLSQIFLNMLEEAEKLRAESLALPTIGLGNPSNGNIQAWMECFMGIYCNFSMQRLKRPFTVHIVCFENYLTSQVQTVLRQFQSPQNPQFPSQLPPSWEQPENKQKFTTQPCWTESADADQWMEGENNLNQDTNSDEKSLPKDNNGDDDNCVICLEKATNPKVLKCGHVFCTDCIDQYFDYKKACPTCGAVCGTIYGDQPPGSIDISRSQWTHLSGFEHYGSINIAYNFLDGTQGPEHPSPGKPYRGIHRVAYLPDNQEGTKICKMLKVAFDRRLVFTIGNSRTTGQDGVITWNDIHHKTNSRPHGQFGYPDPTYLDRVKDELAIKGVTEEDIDNVTI